MKRNRNFILMSLVLLVSMNGHAFVNVTIKGKQAKKIYEHLTGPSVRDEGAAGHLYRKGKDVICKYVNADMTDNQGAEMTRTDSRRYSCAMKFSFNGRVYASSNFSST